jgi:hypothetical protein
MKKTEWKASETKDAKYVGILEFQSNDSEWQNFEVLELPDRLLFGGFCNVGFIESGYILKDDRSTDETLQEMLADLECYYNDGPGYVSEIVCNERM